MLALQAGHGGVFAQINQAVRYQERRLREDLHKEAPADSLSSLHKGEEADIGVTLNALIHMRPKRLWLL